MRAIRSGVTRTVFLIGRWAIKVPSLRKPRLAGFCRGVLANQSEWEWRKDECVVGPVWTLLGLVSVYPRAEPAPDVTEAEIRAIGFIGPMDVKQSSVGYLNGRLLWIDFDGSWNECRRCNQPSVPWAGLREDV